MKKKNIVFSLLCLAAAAFADQTDDVMTKANQLRKQKKPAEAVKILEAALPDVPDARLREFMNFYAKPYYIAPEKGEEIIRRALLASSKDPTTRARTYYQLGLFLAIRKKYDEAVDAWKQALLENHAHPALLMSVNAELSDLLKKQGDKAGALKYCRAALKQAKLIRYKVDYSWLEKKLAALEKENAK